jgi:hypothetical protein
MAKPLPASSGDAGAHSPLPFSVDFGEAVKIKDANGNSILTMMQVHLNGRRAPNEVDRTAKFIVKAANHHEGLVEALRKIAAFDDTNANRLLEMTGSYAAFDEPASVAIARAILSRAI